VEAVAKVSARLGAHLPAFGEVAGMLRRLQGAVDTVLAHAALDEAAAQLWLLALKASLQGVRKLVTAVDQIGASRVLLVLQSPEILASLQSRVRALGDSLALVPKVFADSVSDRHSDGLHLLRSDMQRCLFTASKATLEVQHKLAQLLAAVASKKLSQGGNSRTGRGALLRPPSLRLPSRRKGERRGRGWQAQGGAPQVQDHRPGAGDEPGGVPAHLRHAAPADCGGGLPDAGGRGRGWGMLRSGGAAAAPAPGAAAAQGHAEGQVRRG